MSKSHRDKRAHKARNPEKYFKDNLPLTFVGKNYEQVDWGEVLFQNDVYPNKNFPKIAWSIQGKRRRNTTRKSNQKVKQIYSKIERSKGKTKTRKDIDDENNT